MKTLKEILQKKGCEIKGMGAHEFSKQDYKAVDILGEDYLLNTGLSLLLSRPGIGKTTLALDIALEQAVQKEKDVYIFSPEKRAEEIVERLIVKASGKNESNALKDYDIYIEDFVDEPLDAVLQMKNLIETTCENNFVLIDFLDCLWMSGKGKKISLEERDRLSCELNELAKKKNIKLLASNYATKEDLDLLVCGEFPEYLKCVNTVFLLDRQPFFLDDEFDSRSELQIISQGRVQTKIGLCYNGILRRFVRR